MTTTRSILVDTEVAVAFLVREGVTHKHARTALYKWCAQGRIKNYGLPTRGGAVWDLTQIRGALTDRGGYLDPQG